jgi:hypothetical protein
MKLSYNFIDVTRKKPSKFFSHEYSMRVIFYIYPHEEKFDREGKCDAKRERSIRKKI